MKYWVCQIYISYVLIHLKITEWQEQDLYLILDICDSLYRNAIQVF